MSLHGSLITKNFNISCKGLKPNTIHRFFYEGVDRTILCKSLMPTEINSNMLKTNSSGSVNFSFALAVDKRVYKATYVGNPTIYYDYRLVIFGSKKFELKATDSSATSTVLFADL